MYISIDNYIDAAKFAANFLADVPTDYSFRWMDIDSFRKYAKEKLGVNAAKLGVKKFLDHTTDDGRQIKTGGVYIQTSTSNPSDVTYRPAANQMSGALDIIYPRIKYKDKYEQYVKYHKSAG